MAFFDSLLDSLAENLDKFDQAVEQGTNARRAHVGASAELDALKDELNQVVRVLDGINRSRFAEDPDSLAQWESASNVVGSPRSSRGPADGRCLSKTVPDERGTSFRDRKQLW